MRAEKNSDFREVMEEAQLQGWVVERTKSNHWRFKPPNGGPMVVFSGSPGDWKGFRNFVAALRRGGLDVRRKGHG